MTIEIIRPSNAYDTDNPLDTALVDLTKILVEKLNCNHCGGGLGGEYGYGTHYLDYDYMIAPFCWCEKESCPWCGELDFPNFWHFSSGLKIWWYKWIGRDMRVEGGIGKPEEIIKNIIAGLTTKEQA